MHLHLPLRLPLRPGPTRRPPPRVDVCPALGPGRGGGGPREHAHVLGLVAGVVVADRADREDGAVGQERGRSARLVDDRIDSTPSKPWSARPACHLLRFRRHLHDLHPGENRGGVSGGRRRTVAPQHKEVRRRVKGVATTNRDTRRWHLESPPFLGRI